MKIESRVLLTEQELATINSALEILGDFSANGIRVDDPKEDLREEASKAYDAIDSFLCEYSQEYEEQTSVYFYIIRCQTSKK